MDKELFQLAAEAAVIAEREKGIGTLSEGVLHSTVKYYYQPDPMLHEVHVGGFVCDAVIDDRRLGRCVLEVQTANFRYLKRKLEAFLGKEEKAKDAVNPGEIADNSISKDIEKNEGTSEWLGEAAENGEIAFPGSMTVVYPLESSNQIIWIDPDTGESTRGGRSTKGFIPARCLWELYNLKEFVGREGFTFVILGIKTEEKKLLCGWSKDRKRGSRRVERVPIELTHELIFRERSDYTALIPESLSARFTASEFKKAARMTQKTAQAALYCLMQIGILDREREGRGYMYFVRQDVQKNV
ncbi:MAG: hypothetical protein IJY04_05295 [Clostridia bacterium]|nr:hypothetical protein [Clostridia bacterium]